MRILYYSAHPYLNLSAVSGPGTHMRKVIEAFRNEGHEVVVCIMGGEHLYGDMGIHYAGGGLKKKIKSFIPQVIWQSLKDFSYLRHDRNAEKLLEEQVQIYKPDLIYERGFYMMCSGVRVAQKYNLPHILEMNAPYPEEKLELEGPTWLLKRAFKREKIQIETTSMLVVVSSGLKAYYEGRYPTSIGKVLITPNAIDVSDFDKNKTTTEDAKNQLGISKNALVIGFVGSIFPYHGVEQLLKAFEQVHKKYNNNLHLLIVGDGEILAQLQQTSRDLGISAHVTFTGNVSSSKVQEYIAAMDITVLANSKWYCSPIKIFEYGAMGKAVISINTVAVRDVMEHAKTGLLINAPSELEEALDELIQNKELRTELAKNWENTVMKNHHWNAVGRQILAFYNHLVHKK